MRNLGLFYKSRTTILNKFVLLSRGKHRLFFIISEKKANDADYIFIFTQKIMKSEFIFSQAQSGSQPNISEGYNTSKIITRYITKITGIFILFFLSSHFVSGQNVTDFERWINNATYSQEERCHIYTFQNINSCTIEKLKSFFSKRTDIVLIDYSTHIYEHVNNPVVKKSSMVTVTVSKGSNTKPQIIKYENVLNFSFRKIEWKREGNRNKKDIIEKSIEAGIEHGINGIHTAFIPRPFNNAYKQKVIKWFSNNPEYSIMKEDFLDKYFKITFALEKDKQQVLAYLEKIETFQNVSNIEQMIAARKQYPDYEIPHHFSEIAGRLACGCYLNPNADMLTSLTKSYDTEKKRPTFEDFFSTFPEYKDNTEFKRYFLKSLEFNIDYSPTERFKKFIELFDDEDFALDFVLNSESHKKIASLWCGLKLNEIFEIFGENDNLFIQLITKRMDAASEADIGKYLERTKDYKSVEEHLYNDFLKTRTNPFRTWGSWLRVVRQMKPHLEGNIDLTRLNQCQDSVEKLLVERAERWREALQQARLQLCTECEVDLAETKLPHDEEEWALITTITVQKPGKIVMKNGQKYDFYLNDSGKWNLNGGWILNKTFDTGTEMITYFLEECRKTYCK